MSLAPRALILFFSVVASLSIVARGQEEQQEQSTPPQLSAQEMADAMAAVMPG
jgi:hypothetical protein